MDSYKPTVVCDANVWYKIASGEIASEEIDDKLLIGTFVTAYELSTTPMLTRDYDLVRKTVSAFHKLANIHLTESPLEHMKKTLGYVFTDNDGLFAFEGLEIIMAHEELPNLDLLETNLEVFKQNEKLISEPILRLKEEFQSRIPHRGVYKKQMGSLSTREDHLQVSMFTLSTLIGHDHSDWQQLELCVLTFDEWMVQLSIDPSLKIKPNDWDDLFNLVYVQPGNYYWTLDEKKTKKFIRSCGCSHYLLENASDLTAKY